MFLSELLFASEDRLDRNDFIDLKELRLLFILGGDTTLELPLCVSGCFDCGVVSKLLGISEATGRTWPWPWPPPALAPVLAAAAASASAVLADGGLEWRFWTCCLLVFDALPDLNDLEDLAELPVSVRERLCLEPSLPMAVCCVLCGVRCSAVPDRLLLSPAWSWPVLSCLGLSCAVLLVCAVSRDPPRPVHGGRAVHGALPDREAEAA